MVFLLQLNQFQTKQSFFVTFIIISKKSLKSLWLQIGFVIAPCAADPTSDAYFANAPDV